MRINWFTSRVKESTREGAIDALWRGTEFILAKSNETVPVEEHVLQASGSAQVDESDLVGVVSYDTPYAVKQHEERTYTHKDGRRAKYLELTLQEQADAVRNLMVDQLKRKFR